ncbi:MAG TPA: hypothetical protein VFS19_03485 [Planctomycetota bacterium]|nr:hypothetical protein [Planctomycetota bacterium]
MLRSIALALLAALGSTGPLESCYGYEDHLTLMPDRSGKIDFVMSEKTSEGTLDKVKAGIFQLVQDTRGFAAFTMPALESKDGWAIVRCTVYFEDINLLNYIEDRTHGGDRFMEEKHDECIHFHLMTRPNDKNYFILHVEDHLFSKMPGGRGRIDWEDIKKDSENVVIRRVTVPGKVQWRDAFRDFQRLEVRTVTYERSPKTIGKMEKDREYQITGSRRVEFVGNEIPDAELAAFKKELAAAKAAWPKIKAELEAAPAKK